MARGLIERRIPLLVNGSIDTKSNPKLMKPPALLELENMYQLRTGEMRPRNGFSALSASPNSISGGLSLFPTLIGGLGSLGTGWLGSVNYPQVLRYGNSATGGVDGWSTNSGASGPPFPGYAALVTGIQPYVGATSAAAAPDTVDPDYCLTAGFQVTAWVDGGTVAASDEREATTGRKLFSAAVPTIGAARIVKVAATGGSYMAIFGSSGANLTAKAHLAGANTGTHTIATDLDASPWFDVKAIPGTSLFAVAWRVTAAGGVKCAIYNPATGAITSTVTTAGADSSFCLGWLDDSFATGSMFLATAGSGAGVVARTMSATTMVVSATNVIDATATANVRNVTGHLITGAANYVVFWDVAGTVQRYDKIKRGQWNGAATVTNLAPHHSLYSRSVRSAAGSYYLVGCFVSTAQPTYALIACDSQYSGAVQPAQCYVLSGEAGPRRTQSSLASPVLSGSNFTVPIVRSRKLTTPAAPAAQGRTPALAAFSAVTKVTHARELGGTVFLPGGMIQRDDGETTITATFPLYPEVPAKTAAVGGSMTASGAYAYRIVFRGIDAAGRAYRSAASVAASITLGAGDGTVNLDLFNLKMPPGDYQYTQTPGFGAIYSEIYRQGPAASGATLYNKVGEVRMDIAGADTIAFADTMSDVNAASGEAAYFNGNVLENFHPPATSLLEVNGNRVGIVNAEDPTEFWFSKEYKAGAGIGFHPLNKLAISGDGAGGMTALAAMDGRWILFKRSAIYVLSGDGPNDLGQGSFNQPQAVSRTIGTINPSSVVETPDGIMFQAQSGGFWLLDRGLGLTYIGAPVEQFTDQLPSLAVGAALVPTLPTVRFVTGLASGLMLEWDYYHKRWYVHYLKVDNDGTVVDCANSPLFGWCYLCDTGVLMKESPGAGVDTIGGVPTSIIPRVSFPHLQFAGLAGYQRLKSIDFVLDVLSNLTLSVDAEYNFSGALAGVPKTIALTAGPQAAMVQYTPPEGKAKGSSVRPVITVTGAPGSTFRLTGATAVIGVKRGSNIAAASRMT